jgi:tetratricopeptide (TPR) repeat protein
VLQLTQRENHDPWGTPPEFFYTLAYCQRRAGDEAAAGVSFEKARASAGNIDRFPYREESEQPLAEAVRLQPKDSVARFGLACLLYYQERPKEAIAQWNAAIDANPADFSARRALGLALAEQGANVELAAAQLERAVELNPAHVSTLNDLSALYARAGQFDRQLDVLERGLKLSPADDRLAEGVLTANLAIGRYAEAERLVQTHRFAPRHRTYGLRDKYRVLRYAAAAQAFQRGDYAEALKAFQSALAPPVSLGMDDFATQSSPRAQYYLGRTFEALGKSAEARDAYQKAVAGVAQLTGDRDSWNSENFFVLPSLEKLGRAAEAAALERRFANFAAGERDAKDSERRAEARYLLALLAKRAGRAGEARALLAGALEARPDLLAARLELRGETLDPLASAKGR